MLSSAALRKSAREKAFLALQFPIYGVDLSFQESLSAAAFFRHGLYDESFEKDSCGIGLVANPAQPPSHLIIEQGLEILKNLAHRSALGADGRTSDGAGLLVQIPDEFFRQELRQLLGHDPLPAAGKYAVAQIFSPWSATQADLSPNFWCEEFSQKAQELGLKVIAQRPVPVRSEILGPQAREIEPQVVQIFLRTEGRLNGSLAQKLYQLRTWAEKKFRLTSGCRDMVTGQTLRQFYICSLSTETIVYKGLMEPKNVASYFLDLQNPLFSSSFAMVHSRFSTNTLPAWELAQPFRYSCHNGEINTIRGNREWMRARGFSLTEGRSDSNSFDEALEILMLQGRSLVEAMMMMIPEPWEKSPLLAQRVREFYAYQALRMQPWDGPAALCFSRGSQVGLCLDRNGLRPCRYQILQDGTLIAGSEAGALEVPQEKVLSKGQLAPGRILIVDFESGKIDLQNETKMKVVKSGPFSSWNERERFVPFVGSAEFPRLKDFWPRLLRFGFHYDEILQVLLPLFQDKEEALSSMGYDTPLPLLSDRPQLLTNYFRQQFAQVTNPPIDPIREKEVMSLTIFLGARASLENLESDGKKRWRLESPLLFSEEMDSLLRSSTLQVKHIDATFNLHNKGDGLGERLYQLCFEAEENVRQGAEVLLLSDRLAGDRRAALPSLLLVSAVHHHLIRKNLRVGVSLVAETGEAREPHQFACLLSFGADAVHPYLIENLAQQLQLENILSLPPTKAMDHYRLAIAKGLLKILSKLGISTLQSYIGTQAFEILGLSNELVDKYFPGTISRLGGLNLSTLVEEVRRRWQRPESLVRLPCSLADLPSQGDVHYRAEGEFHQWNPATLSLLQGATRGNDFLSFKKFSEEVRKGERFSLRGHLQISSQGAIALDEVETASEIVKRFTTGAMSLGALSLEAHETLALAMNRIGAKSNSGEGGEDVKRFLPLENGDSKNSAIKQVASGRFGVTTHYLVNAQELQIKMAQGAKPGEGGQLSGHKVDSEIARIRHSIPGVTLISPPPHHDIYSIEDLAQLIFDLRAVNPTARLSVKLVSKAGVGMIAAGVAKAQAQKILISGDGGGTGASALSSIRHAGVPWELGLAETHQTLLLNGLRTKVRLEADGQLRTGRDVAIAALLGADEFGFSTAPLVVEGCLMMRKCHLNTCPVGIATQDPELRQKFRGQAEHVINYFFFVAEELREIMAQAGVRKVAEFVGRSDLLHWRAPQDHWKAYSLDLSALMARSAPLVAKSFAELQPLSFENKNFISDHSIAVKNTDRAVGTALSGDIARQWGAGGLPAQSISFSVHGSVGQSFGAFLMQGICADLTGEANDYVGKGLSGGRIVIRPDPQFQSAAQNSSIVGNTCLYGATSGEAFIAGQAGERFAVRNSGAHVVVEGVGNHACEYMTGGQVAILGPTGKNFAAGMSGGLAFVYDEDQTFRSRCNLDMVAVEDLSGPEDQINLHSLLQRHQKETGSERAKAILASWAEEKMNFVKVVPHENRKILEMKPQVLSHDEADILNLEPVLLQ